MVVNGCERAEPQRGLCALLGEVGRALVRAGVEGIAMAFEPAAYALGDALGDVLEIRAGRARGFEAFMLVIRFVLHISSAAQ